MASDVPETRANSGDDHTRLLALLNDYGISERLQRLLARQLAGGYTRTENGKAVRGEINLQLVVDPIVDQTGLLELLSGLTPNSTTINGTDVSFGGLFANAPDARLRTASSSTISTTGISSIRRPISATNRCGHLVACSIRALTL